MAHAKSPAARRTGASSADSSASCSSDSAPSAKSAPTRSVVARSTRARPDVRDLGQHRSAVVGVGATRDQPVGLEPLHDRGDRRRVHLQPLPHLPQRERAAGGEAEQHQRLVAGEGQPVRPAGSRRAVRAPAAATRISEVTACIAGTPSQRSAHCRAASSIGSNGSGGMGRSVIGMTDVAGTWCDERDERPATAPTPLRPRARAVGTRPRRPSRPLPARADPGARGADDPWWPGPAGSPGPPARVAGLPRVRRTAGAGGTGRRDVRARVRRRRLPTRRP